MRGPGARPIPDPASKRKAWYLGLHAAIEDLYGNDPAALADKDGDAPEIPLEDFLKAVKRVFREKGYRPELLAGKGPLKLVNDTYQAYRQAARTGIAGNEIPEAMARKLDHDAFMFSGFKIHHELSEAGLSLRDEAGKLKSYEQFERDVLKLHDTYNRSWLKSEYGFAVASAQMAAKWQDIEAKKDRYHLQYRTAGDDRVREEHAALHGITLPPDDPFWASYFPPNSWGCRCTAVQVNKGKYPLSDSKEAVRKGEKATTRLDRFGNNKAAIFRFNPGIDERLFPPKHPYWKVDKAIDSTVSDTLVKDYNVVTGSCVPPGLNSIQQREWIDNEHDTEEKLKIRQGKAMSFEEADGLKPNPNYGKETGYSINCQSCVVAYELRRRGFDVEACKRVEEPQNIPQQLAYRTEWAWIDPETGKTPVKKAVNPISKRDVDKRGRVYAVYKKWDEINQELDELTKEAGRYHIAVKWKNEDNGHIFTMERFETGDELFYDPQTGQTKQWSDFMPKIDTKKPIQVLRVDNLEVNTDIIDGIVRPSQKDSG